MEQKKEYENIQRSKASSTYDDFHRNEPIVETQLSMSKDKKYVIHKTIITDIKPVNYWEKVMERNDSN